ncbi:hypothetical protein PIB30_037435 [Stylosanthes scabra]|uniref:Uncharacterized protein n=1 Tax=Stylosanthes scabra TaxID=79078 RepID=A0ABU6RDT3_9FABA|nr:hypothetical protein [Stylosanthes scabra]
MDTMVAPQPSLTTAQPYYRRASAASPFDSSLPAVSCCCRSFPLRSCCSAAACEIIQFICARHSSAAGRRLSSSHCASSKPLIPIFTIGTISRLDTEMVQHLLVTLKHLKYGLNSDAN